MLSPLSGFQGLGTSFPGLYLCSFPRGRVGIPVQHALEGFHQGFPQPGRLQDFHGGAPAHEPGDHLVGPGDGKGYLRFGAGLHGHLLGVVVADETEALGYALGHPEPDGLRAPRGLIVGGPDAPGAAVGVLEVEVAGPGEGAPLGDPQLPDVVQQKDAALLLLAAEGHQVPVVEAADQAVRLHFPFCEGAVVGAQVLQRDALLVVDGPHELLDLFHVPAGVLGPVAGNVDVLLNPGEDLLVGLDLGQQVLQLVQHDRLEVALQEAPPLGVEAQGQVQGLVYIHVAGREFPAEVVAGFPVAAPGLDGQGAFIFFARGLVMVCCFIPGGFPVGQGVEDQVEPADAAGDGFLAGGAAAGLPVGLLEIFQGCPSLRGIGHDGEQDFHQGLRVIFRAGVAGHHG